MFIFNSSFPLFQLQGWSTAVATWTSTASGITASTARSGEDPAVNTAVGWKLIASAAPRRPRRLTMVSSNKGSVIVAFGVYQNKCSSSPRQSSFFIHQFPLYFHCLQQNPEEAEMVNAWRVLSGRWIGLFGPYSALKILLPFSSWCIHGCGAGEYLASAVFMHYADSKVLIHSWGISMMDECSTAELLPGLHQYIM